jgi:hypothetical protein
MSAHLRNADCSPPQAQLAAGVAIFLGKFNYFLINKTEWPARFSWLLNTKRVGLSVFLVTGT